MREACHSELSQFSGKEFSESLSDKAKQSEAVRKYDAIVLGVAHRDFLNLDLNAVKRQNSVVYDVKGILKNADGKL